MRPTAYRRNARGLRDRQAFEGVRMQAGALFAAGRSQAEVARQLGVARQNVSRWHGQWQAGGLGGAGQRRLDRACPRLSDQHLHLIDQARRQGARAHGFDTDHWSLARVMTVIEQLAGSATIPAARPIYSLRVSSIIAITSVVTTSMWMVSMSVMSGGLVFTVSDGSASPAEPVTFVDAGLREREHLQEWVLAHPRILGEDLCIVSFEFDRWLAGSGEPTYDRLDILALDRSGRLIVAELKRDRAPGTVSMQALNYAAMVSRFSLDTLADVFAAYRGSEQLSSEQALAELRDWAPELSDETLGPPRIVLVAAEFGPQVTNTSLFLYENGIDIRLVRAQLYRTGGGELVLTTSQLLPVPTAETFMIRPRSAPPAQAAAREARARRASIPQRLVDHQVFTEGQSLRIVVPAGVGEDRETIEAWLAEEPTRRAVTWRQDPHQPVIWAVDSQPYNLSSLIRQIIEQATGQPPHTQPWGPNWYRDDNDQTLAKIAEQPP